MMIRHNSKFLLALVAGALLSVGQVLAQDELVVEWGDAEGVPIPNALRNAIANDTTATGEHVTDRVYVLKRGGFYWNEDRIDWSGYHLRIIGQTADEADPAEAFVCGDTGDQDCGPAIIQRVYREDGTVDGVMFNNSGSDSDLTLRNVWLMGQDDQGGRSAYEQIALNASDSDFWFDNVIFDKNDWHFLGPNASGCNMYVTNSVFRNLHGPSQQWEGLGVRFEVGADTVMFENNTFLNIGFTPFQSEAAPMNFFVANHNTFVNVGRNFQAGNIWKEAYVANNVFINPFWHGEMPSEYNDPDREDPYTGFFSIGALPARFGTDLDRRIVLANNSYWRDEVFETYGADSIRVQPLVNDTTMGYFNAWDGMVMTGNYLGEMADIATYPPNTDEMIANIVEIRGGSSDATLYPYDPGRDEECFVCNIWPLPEDFSYTNATLLEGGTDGLPLGDLNWFPDDKETYLANREAELAEIIAMAGARVTLDIIATIEGESGVLDGDAEIAPAEGFTYFQMDGGGFIEWSFVVPAEGVHSLVVSTHLRGNSDRGQRIFVNGTNIRNNAGYGEYFWSGSLGDPTDEWFESTITQAGLIEGADALNLPAGENTIRIEPSWGYQHFSGIQVVDASETVVANLTAPSANYEGVIPVCEEADFCPQGFNSALLGAGGSVTFAMDFAADGDYLLRVFYNTAESTTGEVSIDGNPVANIVFDADQGDFLTDTFPVTAGKNAARDITITASGPVYVDFVQVLEFGTTIRNEPNELPEGYALEQNYPNPFNPSTTISYTLADPGDVTLTVYDVVGRQVARLVDGVQGSGTYHVSWNGVGAASGVYFYRLQTPVGYKVRSMVLTK